MITISPEGPTAAALAQEVVGIASMLDLDRDQGMPLCPRCCLSDHYMRTGMSRVFFQQQVRHYKECGLRARCHINHEMDASCLEQGMVVALPAALDPEGPFFPKFGGGGIEATWVPLTCDGVLLTTFFHRRRTVLWLDDDAASLEQIRKDIPGYAGTTETRDGTCILRFEYSNVEAAIDMDIYCFTTADAIKSFLLQQDSLRFANCPPSVFRILSNLRLFVGRDGLREFLDDPSSSWGLAYPYTMIFYGRNPVGLEFVDARPNTVKTTASRDCVAFLTFGYIFPSIRTSRELSTSSVSDADSAVTPQVPLALATAALSLRQ